MQFRDGFILTHADLPSQMAYAPSEETPDFTADGWFEAYSGFDTREEAFEDVEDTARSKFEAFERGDWGDVYNGLDDVPRDEVKRARVFENGTVALYDSGNPSDETCVIDADVEAPELVITAQRAYDDFGMSAPYEAATFSGGIHVCEVIMTITDAEAFEDAFGIRPDQTRAGIFADEVFRQADVEGRLGADLFGIGSVPTQDGFKVKLCVGVEEPDLFVMKAAALGRENGRDRDWTPVNAADAIFEVWFGSNDTGSPEDSGFNVVQVTDPADPETKLGF